MTSATEQEALATRYYPSDPKLLEAPRKPMIPIPIANAINMSYPFGMGGTHGKAKRRIHGRAGEAGAGRP